MPLITRHLPGFAAALIVVLFVGLTLWGYANDLDRAITAPPLPPQTASQSTIVTAYYNRLGVPTIASLLAKHLTQHPVKQLAFAILLSLKPSNACLTAYMHIAPLGPVRGFASGAQYYFGVPLDRLTSGELLLLCDRAFTGSPIRTIPTETLHRRDTLLADLHKRGALSNERYQQERNQALSLTPDHRPIY